MKFYRSFMTGGNMHKETHIHTQKLTDILRILTVATITNRLVYVKIAALYIIIVVLYHNNSRSLDVQ